MIWTTSYSNAVCMLLSRGNGQCKSDFESTGNTWPVIHPMHTVMVVGATIQWIENASSSLVTIAYSALDPLAKTNVGWGGSKVTESLANPAVSELFDRSVTNLAVLNSGQIASGNYQTLSKHLTHNNYYSRRDYLSLII